MPHSLDASGLEPEKHQYGQRYLDQIRSERERRQQVYARAAAGEPAAVREGIALEGAQDRESGRWRIGNVVDSFVTGIRQGMLLDNMIASDPEVQQGSDLPVVRIVGLLAGAIGEGVVTQSWMLRGLQALAKTSQVPKVANAARAAIDGYLVGDDIDLARKIGGHVALGAANEAALNVLGGRNAGETLTATALAGAGGSLLGAAGYGLRARRALGQLDEGARTEATGSLSKLREVVNENVRYEHAMRQYASFEKIEGLDHSDDWRALKWQESHAAHRRMQDLHDDIAKPLDASPDRERSWKSFIDIVEKSNKLAHLRMRGGSTVELEKELAEARARAGAHVEGALTNHKKWVRELGEHARARLAPGAELQTTLFDAAGSSVDDLDYAAMLADIDALLNSGKRFHVQFLRRGSFIDRSAGNKSSDPRNYLEMMHRASTRMEQDKLLEEFVAKSREEFAVKLSPEQAKQALADKKLDLPDGTRVVPFWPRPGRTYPTYAMNEAHAAYLDRARLESTRAPSTMVRASSLPQAEPVWAVETADAFFLPEPIANRLTEKMVGKGDPLRSGANSLGERALSKINAATSWWKYNTILWGVMRFANMQVIGDTLSVARSNPAALLQKRDGKLDSPAIRALQLIFREHGIDMGLHQREKAEMLIGAGAGLGVNEVANDDATWSERAAAGLAGAGLGYAHAKYRAHEALPRILETVQRAEAAGTPLSHIEVLRHVPEPSAASATKLAKTAVRDAESGQPRVVFHGTSTAFEEWDANFLDEAALYGKGFYFTEDAALATEYTQKGAEALGDAAAPNVRVARLRIENPFDIDNLRDLNGPELGEILGRMLGNPEDVQRAMQMLAERAQQEMIDETTSAALVHGDDLYYVAQQFFGEVTGAKQLNEALKSLGHDGITHLGGTRMGTKPHRVWIAFDKEQIFDAFDDPALEAAEPFAATFMKRTQEARYELHRENIAENVSLYKLAEEHGVIGSGGFQQETELARQMLGGGYSRVFPGAGGTRSTQQRARDTVLTMLSGRLHGDPAQFASNWVRSVETVMNERENVLRLASFMQQLESGVDARVAAKRARESLVDYGKFTEFEDKYMRGFLAPFYAFTRHNTANWIKAAAGRDVGGKPAVALAATGAILAADSAAQAWNATFFPEVEAQLAPWQRDQFHVIVGNPITGEPFKDARGRPMVVATEMGYEPTLDLLGLARPHHALNLFGAGIPAEQGLLERKLLIEDVTNSPGHVRETLDGASKMFARLLTPAIRAPIELASNTSWLYDAPIVPEQYVDTPEKHAFVMQHLAKEAFRQYREADKLVRDGGRGNWSPISSAFGLGLPLESVNVDGNVRRALHEQMELAQNASARSKARWAREIDRIVYSRPQWNEVRPDEQERLMQVVREHALSPEEREVALRYYMERTAKSSVQRHWNTLNAKERAAFMRTLAPGDAAAFAFYVNGGNGLVQLAQQGVVSES